MNSQAPLSEEIGLSAQNTHTHSYKNLTGVLTVFSLVVCYVVLPLPISGDSLWTCQVLCVHTAPEALGSGILDEEGPVLCALGQVRRQSPFLSQEVACGCRWEASSVFSGFLHEYTLSFHLGKYRECDLRAIGPESTSQCIITGRRQFSSLKSELCHYSASARMQFARKRNN